jgi:hypothetical protein
MSLYYRVGLGPRLSRMAAAAVQVPCLHTGKLTTVCSHVTLDPTRPTTDQIETPRPQKVRDNTTLHGGGGLAAIAAIWSRT